MPRARIGPAGSAETLAHPIEYTISETGNPKVSAEQYRQIVERVYSSVATEIYRQIESDVKEKILLFPTHYTRAVALYHEAEDFVRSNTIDAYDRAIELYRDALRYFKVTRIQWLTNLVSKTPILWRFDVKFIHMQASIQIGYAKCLIFRRIVSALSGRYRNPLFEIRSELSDAIGLLLNLHNRMIRKWPLVVSKKQDDLSEWEEKNLSQNRLHHLMAYLSFPRDSWFRRLTLRPDQSLFQRQIRILFEAYVTAALTHYYLGATQRAEILLKNAKDVAPELTERNALYLLACGVIEPNIEKAAQFLRKATELAPDFEIAQYLLAYCSDLQFRRDEELVSEMAENTIKEYKEVLKINPGNIASLSALGYLYWLLVGSETKGENHLSEARKYFNAGREVKAVARQTYIGQLNYGLARIATEEGEKGNFNDSYELYNQTLSVDPDIAAYSESASRFGTTSYYDFISPQILTRYKHFKNKVETEIENQKKSEAQNPRILQAVLSFVLNDYGNACFNYFLQSGEREKLKEAIEVLEKATADNSHNKVAYYNLASCYRWRGYPGDEEREVELLEEAVNLDPTWQAGVIALAQARLRRNSKNVDEKLKKASQVDSRAKEKIKEIEHQKKTMQPQAVKTPELQDKYKEKAPNIPEPASIPELELRLRREHENYKKNAEALRNEASELQKRNQEKALEEVIPVIESTKLASIYERSGKKDTSVNDLLKVIDKDRFDEKDVEALRVWAQILSKSNDQEVEKAKNFSNFILMNCYPDNFDVTKLQRDIWLDKLRFLLRESTDTSSDQNTVRWLRKLGFLLRKSKDTSSIKVQNTVSKVKKDIKQFAEQLEITISYRLKKFPKHYEYLCTYADMCNDLGIVYFQEEKYQQARKYFKMATQKALDNSPDYHYNLGFTLQYLQRWDKAIEAHREAVNLDPHNAYSLNELGNAYCGKGEFQKAAEVYKQASDKDPSAAVYHSNRALALANLDRINEADNSKFTG